MRWKTTFVAAALAGGAIVAASNAEVGSGRSREPDVSDPRAIGHRGILDQPSNVGSSSRSNWHAVESARDRGADRIVDDQTWELHRMDEDREARRETEVVLEDRDRTLRLESREGRELAASRGSSARKRLDREVGQSGPASDRDETMSPVAPQIIDDEQAMDEARKEVGRRLTELKNAELREVGDAKKKSSSASEVEQLKAETDRIQGKYKLLREKAMDDFIDRSDRIMGLPKMIEGPIPKEKPSTRPATTKSPLKVTPAQ